MDTRQPAPPPFQRPPDRHMIHNPNHQPASQSYPSYPPPTSQPQQPLHVPFVADPYAASRRDPFLPTASQHARRSSQGIHDGDNAQQAHPERQGGWTNTGMAHFLVIVSGSFPQSSKLAWNMSWTAVAHRAWLCDCRGRNRCEPSPRAKRYCVHDTSNADSQPVRRDSSQPPKADAAAIVHAAGRFWKALCRRACAWPVVCVGGRAHASGWEWHFVMVFSTHVARLVGWATAGSALSTIPCLQGRDRRLIDC